MQTRSLTLLFLLSLPLLISAQNSAFEPEIQQFEKADNENGYQQDFILFTGSSSIRLWNSLEKDMKGLELLNRGFGGSTLKDLNQYWNRISGEHQPDVVVVYCGENDIAAGSSVAETVAEFKKFLSQYQETYPSVPMIYVAMKPSSARWHLWPQYQEADAQIEQIITTTSQVTFIDLSPSMFDKNGQLKQDIFIEDGLHMNKKGYKGWKKQLKPLIREKLD